MIRAEAMQANLEGVQARIGEAAERAGRDPTDIRLVVVAKGHPSDLVEELIEAGIEHIGESYVEEALEKRRQLSSHANVQWHMVGHVQSRKAAAIPEHFDWLHSLDRLKVAQKLDARARQLGVRLPVLLQVNVSGEDSKYGLPLPQLEDWRIWQDEIEAILNLRHLEMRGLMCMAPYLDEPEEARPYFERTRRLAELFTDRYPEHGWSELSMGMSNDFEAAVLEGATLLRLGTVILGPRPD